MAGFEKRNRLLSPHEREVIAHHEMGHAIVAMALPGTDPVHKVSIIPRGISALGYTIQRPTEDRFLMSRDELENKIAVLLGGRAAESIVFPQISTGAADDFSKATEIAHSMVARFGMTRELGQIAYEAEPSPLLNVPASTGWQPRRYSEATAAHIDHAVRDIADQAFGCAVTILQKNRPVLEAAARDLLAQETLDEDKLRKVAASLTRGDVQGLTAAASRAV